MILKQLRLGALLSCLLFFTQANADLYIIDTKGAHAFIQFKISHIGKSWLLGRFNQFQGQFEYDEQHPEKSTVQVTIQTTSVDSNHAERDKHLRDKKLLNVKEHPEAKPEFKS